MRLHYPPKEDLQECPACKNQTARMWPEYDGFYEESMIGSVFHQVHRALFCDICNDFPKPSKPPILARNCENISGTDWSIRIDSIGKR
jgi:hypothetical protein